jgi:hypothetical protein
VTQEVAGSMPVDHPTYKKEICMDFLDQFKGLFGRFHLERHLSEVEALRQKRSEAAKRGAVTRKANAARKAKAAEAKKKKAPAKKKTSRKRAKK